MQGLDSWQSEPRPGSSALPALLGSPFCPAGPAPLVAHPFHAHLGTAQGVVFDALVWRAQREQRVHPAVAAVPRACGAAERGVEGVKVAANTAPRASPATHPASDCFKGKRAPHCTGRKWRCAKPSKRNRCMCLSQCHTLIRLPSQQDAGQPAARAMAHKRHPAVPAQGAARSGGWLRSCMARRQRVLHVAALQLRRPHDRRLGAGPHLACILCSSSSIRFRYHSKEAP